jgi:hypothetical protein
VKFIFEKVFSIKTDPDNRLNGIAPSRFFVIRSVKAMQEA